MTRDQALKQLLQWGACKPSFTKMSECRSVKQMLEVATLDELVYALEKIRGGWLAAYNNAQVFASHAYKEALKPSLTAYLRAPPETYRQALDTYWESTGQCQADYDKTVTEAARQQIQAWLSS